MKRRILRVGATVVAVAIVFGVATSQSSAFECLDWLFGCHKRQTTFYAVAAPATACTTTCGYMPQTCYRSVFAQIPVTTYQPIVSTDPCSGCTTTAYRPITYFQTQRQLVPYTSYRAVNIQTCVPTFTACDPCGSACGTSVGSIGVAGCNSCAATASPDVSLAPQSNVIEGPLVDPTEPSPTYQVPANTGGTNYRYTVPNTPADRMTMRTTSHKSTNLQPVNVRPVITNDAWGAP